VLVAVVVSVVAVVDEQILSQIVPCRSGLQAFVLTEMTVTKNQPSRFLLSGDFHNPRTHVNLPQQQLALLQLYSTSRQLTQYLTEMTVTKNQPSTSRQLTQYLYLHNLRTNWNIRGRQIVVADVDRSTVQLQEAAVEDQIVVVIMAVPSEVMVAAAVEEAAVEDQLPLKLKKVAEDQLLPLKVLAVVEQAYYIPLEVVME